MVPPKTLIALNIIDLSLVKILFLSTALKYCVNMIWACKFELPRYVTIYFQRKWVNQWNNCLTNRLQIWFSFLLKIKAILQIFYNCIVVPSIFFLVRFPCTVHVDLIWTFSITFLNFSWFFAYRTFRFLLILLSFYSFYQTKR